MDLSNLKLGLMVCGASSRSYSDLFSRRILELRPPRLAASFISNQACDVRWHKADILEQASFWE
jgi:hypothetical protein